MRTANSKLVVLIILSIPIGILVWHVAKPPSSPPTPSRHVDLHSHYAPHLQPPTAAQPSSTSPARVLHCSGPIPRSYLPHDVPGSITYRYLDSALAACSQFQSCNGVVRAFKDGRYSLRSGNHIRRSPVAEVTYCCSPAGCGSGPPASDAALGPNTKILVLTPVKVLDTSSVKTLT